MNQSISTLHFDTPLGWWDLALVEPPADLAHAVESFWAVRGRAAFSREQILPNGKLELMFNLGGAYRVLDRVNGFGGHSYRRAWISGLQEVPITIEPEFDPSTADAEHVAVTLTPHGAYQFFGLPMAELRGQVFELEALLNLIANDLQQRLLEAPSLHQRFELMVAWVRQVLANGPSPDRHVRHAFGQLKGSRGQVRVQQLCDELGVSRSWLARRFKDQVGMSPKRFARVLKFQHAVERVEQQAEPDWPDLAVACGYYDQAHLIREFKAHSGHTPATYRANRAPGGGSVVLEP